MARMPELRRFARKHKHEDRQCRRAHRVPRPRTSGSSSASPRRAAHALRRLHGRSAYRTLIDTTEHLALVMGDLDDARARARARARPVRDRRRLRLAALRLRRAARAGDAARRRRRRGVIVYMDQEGRGIGLHNKIRAYGLQDDRHGHRRGERGARASRRPPRVRHRHADPARPRRAEAAADDEQPDEARRPEGFGLEIVERVPIEVAPNPHNVRYLQTKREKMGHSGRGRASASMRTLEGPLDGSGAARRRRRLALQRADHGAAARGRAGDGARARRGGRRARCRVGAGRVRAADRGARGSPRAGATTPSLAWAP